MSCTFIDHTNQYNLEKQALMTGFGKMIPSKNQTNPKYSFSKDKRSYQKAMEPNTDYIYHPFPENTYKYIKVSYIHIYIHIYIESRLVIWKIKKEFSQ